MTTYYVLIILSGIYGGQTVHSEVFDTQSACWAAASWVKASSLPGSDVKTKCFPSDRPDVAAKGKVG
jgi:hypothetical protein